MYIYIWEYRVLFHIECLAGKRYEICPTFNLGGLKHIFTSVRKRMKCKYTVLTGGKGRGGQSRQEKWVRKISLQLCASETALLTGWCFPVWQGDPFILQNTIHGKISLFSCLTKYSENILHQIKNVWYSGFF